jgi:hypothetical protein
MKRAEQVQHFASEALHYVHCAGRGYLDNHSQETWAAADRKRPIF